MRLVLLAGVAAAFATAATVSPAVRAADAGRRVVIELFQSQGCSSCPPANANLNALADRPDVLALSFGVTYWDHLGWKDTFAKKQFTDRQWDYARARRRGSVWTPQVYVDGRSDVVGSDRAELDAAVKDAAAGAAAAPDVRITSDRVTIGRAGAAAPPSGGADVWLVRYDSRIVQVPVKAGENGGRTLPHRNVVRELVRLGSWTGEAASFDVPQPGQDGLSTAVLVQAGTGGPILAAARG
ncbi:MAG TPA: DUF1223 domain-containing protein [Stellaceae bacterium]